MSDRLWGVGLTIIGAVMIWDGWLLGQNERATSVFDFLGPDRYGMLIGALIAFCGLVISLSRSTNAAAGEGNLAPVSFTIALSAYAAIMPWLGYTIATFVFFVAAFLLAGRRKLLPTLFAGAVSTAGFYFIFVYFADMPLPTGVFGI
ncbi:tripartite tricarboxylate transporter TctB family protein [Bosea sp. (in: a-proteobacteria)]|uniref:tripartite tricarboxylate transporter TctB family protein n=1 Tax=Bosea sp. (in: a-proteobacteria) TaxID=1871050 RepID=UPI0026111F19|nr:tripartite tricarboxylate transporter TctB family protein [Bosea sp. (in: a-proteobacteria)]MCO5090105.1 tripartite tricarboxylate transporter TctB family protein [Bosea sp. (in: a-proteobacteria)]